MKITILNNLNNKNERLEKIMQLKK